MGNIISYLKWRGDISFSERPFCEVDNLVLSELSYMRFNNVVPAPGEDGSISLKDALRLVKERHIPPAVDDVPKDFIDALSSSVRFKDAQLYNYLEIVQPREHMQFAALHIKIDDGTVYIAFRGTSNEIDGWREDFSMSYQIMPSQRYAAAYLKDTLSSSFVYRIGGHSKGGNLALYAAMNCPDDMLGRIKEVYSNDGPGLCPEIIDMTRYDLIRDKLIRIVPDYCLIGKLFEQDSPNLIVKTSVNSAMAHSGFLWEVEGDSFVPSSPSGDSKFFNDIFDTWIESANMEQRETFTRDFFDALGAGGAKKMSEITAGGMDGIATVLLALIRSEGKTKVVIGKFISSTAKTARKIDIKKAIKTKEMLFGFIAFVIGLFIVAAPGWAEKFIGIAFGIVVVFTLAKYMIKDSMKPDTGKVPKKWKMGTYIVLMCIFVTLINQTAFLSGFTRLVMAVCFFWLSYKEIKKAAVKNIRISERVFHIIIAVLSLLFGILPIVVPALEMVYYTICAGSFIIIYGVALMVKTIFKRGKSA